MEEWDKGEKAHKELNSNFDQARQEPSQKADKTTKPPPQPKLEITPPSLGSRSLFRKNTAHAARQEPIKNTPEEIRAWALDKATHLKTEHSAQRQELENQHHLAFQSKLDEFTKKEQENQLLHQETVESIRKRMTSKGLSALFYKSSGQEKNDQALLEENDKSFRENRSKNAQEFKGFLKAMDKEKAGFEDRCNHEVEKLKSEIHKAHKEERIPNRNRGNTHENEGHTR